jgi:uncharacterized membrane protein YraQ (UPF0718 family)
LLISAALTVVVLRFVGFRKETDAFCAFFFAITLSAIPYILLGAIFSGLTEVFMPPELLLKISRRLGVWGVPAMAIAAPAFPICECGVVSVVRGLLRKGLPLPYALTYLLAAPIVNPIVAISTYMAFQSVRYALFRVVGGLCVSIGLGLLFWRMKGEKALAPEVNSSDLQNGGCCSCHSKEPWLARVVEHAVKEFLDMIPYFLMGVFAASAMKALFSDSVLAMAGGSRIWGPAVMMLAAFVLSLCSEADAFPAASFTTFSFPAHMAFLVLGPMLDIKLLLMFRRVFRPWFIIVFAASIVAAVSAYVVLTGILL